MKSKVVVFILICVLSSTLGSKKKSNPKVQKVHSAVMSYVHEKMGNNAIMRGNSVHLECYNVFIPLINNLAANARDVSSECVRDADQQKDEDLSALKKERQKIESEVDKITKSLTDCSKKDGLDYFECLADNTELNRQLMELISVESKDLISKYAAKAAEIDQNEQLCLMSVIEMTKVASDKAFEDLKSCLNGGPAIQPFIDGVL